MASLQKLRAQMTYRHVSTSRCTCLGRAEFALDMATASIEYEVHDTVHEKEHIEMHLGHSVRESIHSTAKTNTEGVTCHCRVFDKSTAERHVVLHH